jgi:hypothetical protein
MTTNFLSQLTDIALHQKAKRYGSNALLWRRKFLGLLPEIQRRKLYEQKGFNSIFEFAVKLAGVSEQQVRTALNLGKRFEETPLLKNLLITGEVSVNKLARVASIATPQNQEELSQMVKVLPQSALETLVRDENGLRKPQMELKLLRAQDLNLNEELTKRLLTLQAKGLDLNEILMELLDKREVEIAEEKDKIAKNLPETQPRPIPVATRKILHKEHGTICSIPTCNKPAEHLHHTQTFALSHRHDPYYLAPLCKNHHLLAHSINLKVQEQRRRALT